MLDIDSDGDSTPDCIDPCPGNPTDPGVCYCEWSLDIDWDDIMDCTDSTYDDTDLDGFTDDNDGCVDDPNKRLPGVCGCGVADADTDSDGIVDCIEGSAAGLGEEICIGLLPDGDNDGMPDLFDNCPNDSKKIDPEYCGCGQPEYFIHEWGTTEPAC